MITAKSPKVCSFGLFLGLFFLINLLLQSYRPRLYHTYPAINRIGQAFKQADPV